MQGNLSEYSLIEVLAGAGTQPGRNRVRFDTPIGSAYFVVEGQLVQMIGSSWPADTPVAEVCFDLLANGEGEFSIAKAPHDQFDMPTAFNVLFRAIEAVAASWREVTDVVPALTSVVTLHLHSTRAALLLNHTRWQLVHHLVPGPLTVTQLAGRVGQTPLAMRKAIAEAFVAGLVTIDGRIARHQVFPASFTPGASAVASSSTDPGRTRTASVPTPATIGTSG
jgi:hypothetical protein